MVMLFHYKKIFSPTTTSEIEREGKLKTNKNRAAKQNMNKCKKNKKLCGVLVAIGESSLRLEQIHRLFGASSLGLAGEKLK
jgi:hypothetical protein